MLRITGELLVHGPKAVVGVFCTFAAGVCCAAGIGFFIATMRNSDKHVLDNPWGRPTERGRRFQRMTSWCWFCAVVFFVIGGFLLGW